MGVNILTLFFNGRYNYENVKRMPNICLKMVTNGHKGKSHKTHGH